MDLEKRVTELESKVAFQDETIDILNEELKAHQMLLAKLRRQTELLGEKLKEVQSGSQIASPQEETPPPHY